MWGAQCKVRSAGAQSVQGKVWGPKCIGCKMVGGAKYEDPICWEAQSV